MYNVTIKEAKGSCNNSLLTKMLKNGDVNFIKLNDVVNEQIHVRGYCFYTGEVLDENGSTKDINNYLLVDTQLGYIRTGSEVFKDAFVDYIADINNFVVRKIKCNKGFTFKPEPILFQESEDIVNEE